MTPADDDFDEETGLLDSSRSVQGASPTRAVKLGDVREDFTTTDTLVSRIAAALRQSRVVAAWRQPIGASSAVPEWLRRRVVLTSEEENCLSQLRHLASISYDNEDPVHDRHLRRFFAAVRSPEEARGLASEKDPRWKELGFQSEDPRTDFRGGGLLSLQNMCYLAETYPDQVKQMLEEASGTRSRRQGGTGCNSEYLFAAACVNISSMLVLLLGLNVVRGLSPARDMPCPVNLAALKNFARTLCFVVNHEELPAADVLGELFANAVMKLHAEWQLTCALKPGATLLDFGDALSATAVSLERLLDTLGPCESEKPFQSIFSVLDFVKPRTRITRCRNVLFQWYAALLEIACRFLAALAELLQGSLMGKRSSPLEL